jgi:hypothetical protein
VQVAANAADLEGKAREAFRGELYRGHEITQHQLGETLGLSE